MVTMKPIRRIIQFTLACIFAGQVIATEVGEIATDFTIENHSTGGELKLSDYAGQVVVLDFFAWWCGPCKISSPVVVEEIEEFFAGQGGNANGVPVTVLGVSIESSAPDLTTEFISDTGMTLVADDHSKTAYNQFSIDGLIPLFVIINGVENSASHQQWEVLYREAGFAGADALRAVINQVQPAASSDTTAPVISLNGDAAVTINIGETYSDSGASANDDTDGTVPVSVSNPVNSSTSGVYTVTYTAQDSAANSATATRVVTVTSALAGEAQALGGTWFYYSWFGAFHVQDANWIYHETLGWLFISASGQTSVWLYDDSLGWCWTSNTAYPWLSQSATSAGALPTWLYYHRGSSNPRFFYNYDLQFWDEN